MSSNHSSTGPSHSLPLPAHRGIKLREAGDVFEVVPQGAAGDDPAHPPFLMPMVPGKLADRMADLLMTVWRLHRCSATFLLYLDVDSRKWDAYLPPQTVSYDGVSADPNFGGVEAPPNRLRLAGTFRSSPYAKLVEVIPHLPRVEGLHLVLHPLRGRRDISAYLYSGEDGHSVWAEELAVDWEHDHSLDHLLDRIRPATGS